MTDAQLPWAINARGLKIKRLLGGLLAMLCAGIAGAKSPAVEMKVETGLLSGLHGDGVDRFFGIPYAQPPLARSAGTRRSGRSHGPA